MLKILDFSRKISIFEAFMWLCVVLTRWYNLQKTKMAVNSNPNINIQYKMSVFLDTSSAIMVSTEKSVEKGGK